MRTALPLLVALVAAVTAPPPAATAQPNPRPSTLPTIQAWKGAEGQWQMAKSGRVVTDRRTLLPEARQLARDLRPVLGRTPPVALGPPHPGDVALHLGVRDPRLGSEGYRLIVDDWVRIRARATAGVYYGGRTLLQLLAGDRRAPRGVARDRPRWPERGLMVDNGRKFFTPGWLEARVRELGALKLNILHLHLSDNEGFRIESERHPEIVTRPALTKAQVRRLVAVAARHHVTVVPEIDMPGHLRAALAPHPELQLTGPTGDREADKLDVTLPAARAFARDLVEEYLPLFPGPWWHTGADEYLGVVSTPASYELHPQLGRYARAKYGPRANGKDAVLDFTNLIGELVRRAGKRLRAWSDGVGGGAATRLDLRTTVEWWEEQHSPAPQALVDAGHRVLNAGWWPTYYVNGPLAPLRADLRDAYEQWQPYLFDGPYTRRWAGADEPSHRLRADEPTLTGAKLQVWNDDPNHATEAQIAAGIAPRLRLIAQKTWGAPAAADTFGRIERGR